MKNVDEISVFVSSFFSSADNDSHIFEEDAGDVLSQWRAYSKGSGGFSLGFDKGSMSDFVAQREEDPVWPMIGSSCLYDREIQEGYILSRITDIYSILNAHFEPLMNRFETQTLPALLDLLNATQEGEPLSAKRRAELSKEVAHRIVASLEEARGTAEASFSSALNSQFAKIIAPTVFMKHPAFSLEREWRIAQLRTSATDEIKFRFGKPSLIPYVEIPFPLRDTTGASLIRRIVVGPTPELQNAIAAVRMLLESRGFLVKGPGRNDGVEIVGTKIPYRDW